MVVSNKRRRCGTTERNGMMMVQWMCRVTLQDRKSSCDFRDHLRLVSIRNYTTRVDCKWFGHIESLDILEEWTMAVGKRSVGRL